MAREAQFLPADVTDVHFEIPEPHEATEAQKRADALREALSEDSDAFITIFRHPTGAGTTGGEFVDRLPADKYDHGELLIYLKTNYGAGDYRVRLYAKGKLKANTLISIARGTGLTTDKTPASVGGEVAQVLAQILAPIREQQAQMLDFMRQSTGGNSRREMLEEMMLYKNLFSTPNSGGLGQLKEALSLLEMVGIKPGNTIEGETEDEGESTFSTLIKALAPVALEATRQRPHAQPHAQPQAQPQPEKEKMNVALMVGISTLISAAKKKSNPANYVDMILDSIGEDKILPIVSSVDTFKQFISTNAPQAVQYGAWFLDLREHLAASLGLPSKYAHLYADSESDITGEIVEDTTPDNDHIPTEPHS